MDADKDEKVLTRLNMTINKDITSKRNAPAGGRQEHSSLWIQNHTKGIETSNGPRILNNSVKKPKADEHKEVMLGRKRGRQTVLIDVEDSKQQGSVRTSTSNNPSCLPAIATRTVKGMSFSCPVPSQQDVRHLDQNQTFHEPKGYNPMEVSDDMVEKNDNDSQIKKIRGGKPYSEAHPQDLTRKGSQKQMVESRQFKKQSYNQQPLDASVERLVREVTSNKFWHHPEETELQRVPGRFECVEEYIRVFEPLLFEECRAQLYSTWKEAIETSKDAHVAVDVRCIGRRERGWCEVKLIPSQGCRFIFKDGEVAILSTPRPGAGADDVMERVIGIIKRYTSSDSRNPSEVMLRFHLGDFYDSNCTAGSDSFLEKLRINKSWYLTTIGTLTTTQREYVALHAFPELSEQMQTAILKPSPKQYPNYEDQTPAIPKCFTPCFTDYICRTFNGPQLAAIQWAAVYTAAGTSKQESWPFTLVQGPPGTGKTQTVWGMLNVIHLVQYQHYYSALLKKLAPESCKQFSEPVPEVSVKTGSLDEFLLVMDKNLSRSLPKLCPKPRMLVCAPSNAATDELLTRVLDRGFVDGEMKVYRPDIARVGVDSQTRAAQAVSVERRTEQLLLMGRNEVVGWMHQLKTREFQLSQEMVLLQRQLYATSFSQESVGVDPDELVARDQKRDKLLQNLASVVEQRDKVLVELTRLCVLERRFRVGTNFNLDEARAQLEASFADEAEIVFTTVSSSGRRIFSHLSHGFDMVVIDEAAQASEMSVLTPLALGAARCVLVGDPQQLPATVISKAAGTLLYSRSLFERLQQASCPAILLSVQYRMHPKIRDFPSRYFYQGRLTDSESVASLTDEIYYADYFLQPYLFFDVEYGRESQRGASASYENAYEARFALMLYDHLQKFLRLNGGKKVSVGIITPYKLQLKCIQQQFEEVLKSDGRDLYINTIDAFQGQERDVIIMSCVRASSNGVGFVADIRRMNVALTRARRALWVLGNANALMQSDDWAALIKDAKSRNCFRNFDMISKRFFGSAGFPSQKRSVIFR